jgi:hypothetical protein
VRAGDGFVVILVVFDIVRLVEIVVERGHVSLLTSGTGSTALGRRRWG